MTDKEFLEQMRRFINGGWVQEDFCQPSIGMDGEDSGLSSKPSCYCLAGAGFAASLVEKNEEITGYSVYDETDNTEAEERIARLLGFDRISDVYTWNDQDGRTCKEVLDFLDRAIEKVAA